MAKKRKGSLQFGHGTKAVETGTGDTVHIGAAGASIRPRHKGCGDEPAGELRLFGQQASIRPRHKGCGDASHARRRSISPRSFNSATAQRLWRPWLGIVRRPADIGFNSATAQRLWRRGGSYPQTRHHHGFNSATAQRLWRPGVGGVLFPPFLTLQFGHSTKAVETRVDHAGF